MTDNSSTKPVAVVTGASAGIGAVYARRLAARGFDLILVARRADRLEALSKEVQERYGSSVEVVAADLTDPTDLTRLEKLVAADKRVTMLVNNAGNAKLAPLSRTSTEDAASMIALNVTALTRLALAVVPGFVERKNGLLINIASVVALAPELLNGTYSGSKAYVVNFTQALKNEVEGKGVTVQAVLPGATATPFWDRAGLPVHNLPGDWVMTSEDMVDASLAGLERHELVTIPSLPDIADWETFEAARKALGPNLSRQKPAARYEVQG